MGPQLRIKDQTKVWATDRTLLNVELSAMEILSFGWYQRQIMHGELEKAGDGEAIANLKELAMNN